MEEMQDILDFIAKYMDKLSMEEQATIFLALTEMATKVKPIYLKHQIKSGNAFFIRLNSHDNGGLL